MNTIKLIAVNFAIFAGLLGLLYLVFPTNLISFDVHGWGWAVILPSCLAVSFASTFLQGVISGAIGDNVEVHPEIIYVGKEVLSWLTIGAGFAVGAWLAPSLVTAAALPVLLYWGLFGLASGVADVITERLGYGSKRRS